MFDLIVLLGFFVGAILYGALFIELVNRSNKLKHEYVFLMLVAVLTVWHSFQFLALFIKQVFGRSAIDVYTQLRYIAIYSLAFFPPVIVHLHASFLEYVQSLVGKVSRMYNYLAMAFYLPLGLFFYFGQFTIVDERRRILAESMSFVPSFVFGIIVCLAVSAVLSLKIVQSGRNEKWRQFFILEIVIMAVISAFLVYFYFFGGTGNVRLDRTLKNLLMMSSVIPTSVMIYLMYKYPFYSTVARRRFLLVTIAGAFLTIYVVVSKMLRKMANENPGLNFELMEIVAVSLLFGLYDPTKYFIRRLAGYYALSERHEFQSLIRNITEKIAGTATIEELSKTVQSAVLNSLKVEEMALFLLTKHVYPDNTYYSIQQKFGAIKDFDLKLVIKNLDKGNGLYDARRINIFHLRATEIPYQIYVSIILNEDVVGILAIGKKKSNEEFALEEKEWLMTVASQVAVAIENVQLMNRRMELEAKMFEADKLSSLGLLSTSIAHEVKNPLSSIKSIVQSMRDEKTRNHPNSDEIQDLDIINEEIDRLNLVVSQLLKFARSDAAPHQVDATKIIDTILTLLRQETRQRSITVYTKYDSDNLVLLASAGELKEILFNLVINGVQSMESGGRLMIHGAYVLLEPYHFENKEVSVFNQWYPDQPEEGYRVWTFEPVAAKKIESDASAIPPDESGKITCVKIAIADSGLGIPEERISEIFKPFFTTKSLGTGLGLAIVKNKIDSLGGKLVVRSAPKAGTCFEVYIPVKV